MTNVVVGVDKATLFSNTSGAAFAGVTPIVSDIMNVSETRGGVSVFAAPTGVGINVQVQVQDPESNWHSVTNHDTVDGACDDQFIPAAWGKVRVSITPTAGAGHAIVWAVAGA